MQGKVCAVLLNCIEWCLKDTGSGSLSLGAASFLTVPRASCLTVRNLLQQWELKYLVCFYMVCGIFEQKLKLMHLLPAEPPVLQHVAEWDALIFLNTILALECYSSMLSVLF